jgi:hypothetical protein
MRLILGCLLVLTGLALAATRVVPEARMAFAGVVAPTISHTEAGKQRVEQEPGYETTGPAVAIASVKSAPDVGGPEITRVSHAPESSQPNSLQAGNPAESIEIMRENERRQTALDQLKRLLAQRVVLIAERDGGTPRVPQQLVELVGQREARKLVAAQAVARAAANAETQEQDTAFAAVIEGIKREISALRERIAQIEAGKEIKSDRLKRLLTLSKGVVAGNTIADARIEIANIEERRQDALMLIAQAEQRLAQTELERSKLARHARAELERELLMIEAQIAQGEVAFATSHGILTTMQNGLSAPTMAPAPRASAGRLDL